MEGKDVIMVLVKMQHDFQTIVLKDAVITYKACLLCLFFLVPFRAGTPPLCAGPWVFVFFNTLSLSLSLDKLTREKQTEAQ